MAISTKDIGGQLYSYKHNVVSQFNVQLISNTEFQSYTHTRLVLYSRPHLPPRIYKGRKCQWSQSSLEYIGILCDRPCASSMLMEPHPFSHELVRLLEGPRTQNVSQAQTHLDTVRLCPRCAERKIINNFLFQKVPNFRCVF